MTPHQSLLELHVQLSTIHTAFCIIRGSSLASPIYCLWYSFSLMAPILKPGGIPVNQYTQTYPLINCLCCCQDCLSHTVVDPISKAVYQGSYVSPAQRKDHQNRELARGITSIQLRPTHKVPQLDFAEASPRQQQPLAPASITPDHTPQPFVQCLPIIGLVNHHQTNNPLMTALEGIKQKLGRSHVAHIVANRPLVFQSPPNHDVPPIQWPDPQAFALEENVPANGTITGHKSWLDLAIDLIQGQGSHSGDVKVRLLAKVLLGNLRNEMKKLQEFKSASNLPEHVECFNTGAIVYSLACKLALNVMQ